MVDDNKVDHVKERDELAKSTLEGNLLESLLLNLEKDHGIQKEEGEKLCKERSDLIISGVKSLADRIAATRRDTPVSKPDERAVRS